MTLTILVLSLVSLVMPVIRGDSDYIDHYGSSEIEQLKTFVSAKPSINSVKYYKTSESNFENLNVMEESELLDRETKNSRSGRPGNWFLLGLSGNTSLVHKRLPDFMNYLKINLGGLAGTDYEDVTVNSVSYVPSLIVNISFSGNYNVSQLIKISNRNDSVLVLSSVSFYLTSFTSSEDILIPKPLTNSLSTPREEEAMIYLGVGATIAFLLSTGVLVSILIRVSKKDRIKDKKPLIGQSTSFSRYQDPPQMIYSENFSQSIGRETECLTSTPFDDNFLPIDTEDDFVPRYIKEDDCSSWLSDRSVIENHPVVFSVHNAKNQSLSDDGLETAQEIDKQRKMSKSPFYWNIETHSPMPTLTPNPLPHNLPSQHSDGVIKTRKRPPRPPSRTDSLNPNSKSKRRPKSSIATKRRCSDLPGRPLSVPSPYHLTHKPGSLLSIPRPTPTSRRPSSTCSSKLFVSQEEIDKDVDLILRNLGIEKEY